MAIKTIGVPNANEMSDEDLKSIEMGLANRSLIRQKIFGDKPINKETIEYIKKYLSYGAEAVQDLDRISQIDDPKKKRKLENAWMNDYVFPKNASGSISYHIEGAAGFRLPFVYMKKGKLTEAIFTLDDIKQMGLAERVRLGKEKEKLIKETEGLKRPGTGWHPRLD